MQDKGSDAIMQEVIAASLANYGKRYRRLESGERLDRSVAKNMKIGSHEKITGKPEE